MDYNKPSINHNILKRDYCGMCELSDKVTLFIDYYLIVSIAFTLILLTRKEKDIM